MSKAMGLSKMIDRYVDALYSISNSLDEFSIKETLQRAVENLELLSKVLRDESIESRIDMATLSAIAFLEKRISKELPDHHFKALYNSIAEILRIADDLKKKLSPANYQRLIESTFSSASQRYKNKISSEPLG
jgi:hypothetical protein